MIRSIIGAWKEDKLFFLIAAFVWFLVVFVVLPLSLILAITFWNIVYEFFFVCGARLC